MILAPTLSAFGGSSGVVRPTFSRDFAGEKTLNNGTGPAITFTRASNATYFDANGVLQTASNNVPRFDHDPATGASRGLLIEEARTNSIRNAQAGGSTNGVIGSGGVMPTNWSISANANGITSEIIGTGTEDGLPYIDIKMSGTPTASSNVLWRHESDSQVVAANGQTWIHSAYVRLVSGSTANTSIRISISGRVAGGTQVIGQGGDTIYTPTSAALKTQRQSRTFTFTDATVERVLPFCYINYTSGNPIDLTLRIAAPQLEQGAFPTSYIPTTTAAATRSADFARVTPISSFYNQSEGTAFAEYSRFQISANSKALLFLDNATPSRYLGIESTADGTASRFISQNNAGSTVASLSYGNAAANTVYKQIGTYKENDFIAAQNGTLTSADTSGTPTDTLDRMGVGCLPGVGNFPLNGHIRKIAYWPKRLTNTLLQQLTT